MLPLFHLAFGVHATSWSPRLFLPLPGREEGRRWRTQSSVDHHNTLVASARADRALVLGRYRLRERLGAGGFGVVWRAHDELLHREVAVKQISLPTDEDRDRATREALATARLAHPAIVALYEACPDEQDFYLISELVQGETLAQVIAADSLGDEELLEVGIVLCDALAHAHARGVIHRDVKPQNILLPDAPEDVLVASRPVIAKLTDFGGAHLAGEDALTRTGDVLGTLAYMAPEQSEGREVGAAADLYSLALVIYEALSGVNPVRGPTPAATVRRIGRPLPPLERHRGDLPRPLTRALDAALSPEPEDRGSLGDLRGDLEQALEDGLRRSRRRRTPSRIAQVTVRDARIAPAVPLAAWAPTETSGHADGAERAGDSKAPRIDTAGWLTLARLAWLAGACGLCAWQVAAGRPGVALLGFCAVLPLVLLVRRPGPGWLAAGVAPILGLAGLAGAFPALAGQAAHWRERALAGALGYWWLRLAEPLLDRPGRRLWLGVTDAPGGHPARRLAWESSLGTAASHALLPILTVGLLFGVVLWALAAALLPLVVRGASAMRDALAVTTWAVALAAATPLLVSGLPSRSSLGATGGPAPRGVILGAALGAVLAIAARALFGRAPEQVEDGRAA
jgi:eukaryotic-like serine/threonine-protein kinase